MTIKTALLLGVLALFCSRCFADSALQEVVTHDNERNSTVLENQIAKIHLEITRGNWHPEESDGPSLEIQAFAEPGKSPQIPGPTFRIPPGSNVLVDVRNTLAVPAEIHGFPPAHGIAGESIVVQPGATRFVPFIANYAGYFLYWASTQGAKTLEERHVEDSQLAGVIEVQPSNQKQVPIFVLGHWWKEKDPRELWVINGRMWPFTSRFTEKVGEPFRAVWINSSDEGHPMHLHGSYFSVPRESIHGRDVAHPSDGTPFVTTHVLEAGDFMLTEWTPLHAGNWLFHCHILFHTDFGLGLNPALDRPSHMEHSSKHMAGLIVGFTATGEGPVTAEKPARKLKLIVGERNATYESFPGYGLPPKLIGLGYQLQEGDGISSANPLTPGPVIVLERNQPVEITIENHLKEATSVHWHGIELESYYDGVPGWGGETEHITPSIPAGHSFVAKFTPPRAGSFMYHTHLNDFLQLSLGLAGPLIVLESAKTLDSEHDQVFMITRDGPDDEKAPWLVNGSTSPPPLHLQSGVPYRLRFLELTTAQGSTVSIRRKDGQPVRWNPLAKDGADLAESQRAGAPATMRIETGETFDYIFTPEKAEYRIEGTDGSSNVLYKIDVFVD